MRARTRWLLGMPAMAVAFLAGCEGDGGRSVSAPPASDYGVSDPSMAALVVINETESFDIVGVWLDNLSTSADNRDTAYQHGKPWHMSQYGLNLGRVDTGNQAVFSIEPGVYRIWLNWGTRAVGRFVSLEFEARAGTAAVFSLHGGRWTGRTDYTPPDFDQV